MSKEEEYKRFIIPNNFRNEKKKEILIRSPEMCAICCKTDIEGDLKVVSDMGYKSRYIKVPLCSKHYKIHKKTTDSKILSYPCLVVFGIMCLAIFIYLLIPNYVLFAIISFSSLFYFAYALFSKNKLKSSIMGYIFFRYSKNGSVIAIRDLNWAKEFKRMNEVRDFFFDSKSYEKYRKKSLYNFVGMILSGILPLPILIVAFIYGMDELHSTTQLIGFFFILAFGIRGIYFYIKADLLKAKK
jgi:hypothetical protein